MEEEATEQTQPEPEKPVKADRAPREKPVERPKAEKLVFTTDLADEVRKYWDAPENQAKIAVFLQKVGLEAGVLTDEQRHNFALMIEGKKEG